MENQMTFLLFIYFFFVILFSEHRTVRFTVSQGVFLKESHRLQVFFTIIPKLCNGAVAIIRVRGKINKAVAPLHYKGIYCLTKKRTMVRDSG